MASGKGKTIGTENKSIVAKGLGKGQEGSRWGDDKQDQLQNLQGPVKNENARPRVLKLLRTARQ